MGKSAFVKSLFSIILFAAWHIEMSAQVEARVEWDNKGDYNNSYVESMKEKGALLYQRFLLDCTAQKQQEKERNQNMQILQLHR